jgi:hypothetical protein
MKKLIFLLAIMFTFVAVQAQVRTLSTKNVTSANTYASYTGVTADTISTNQDTLRIPFFVAKDYPMSYTINSTLAPRAGADTTVVINVYGKVFEDDAWTKIQTATTSAITASAITKTTFVEPVLATAQDTVSGAYNIAGTITNPFTSATAYRYYMIEYIISGDDSVGTGVKLTKLEWKWYYRPY